jgi:hypothetical protein
MDHDIADTNCIATSNGRSNTDRIRFEQSAPASASCRRVGPERQNRIIGARTESSPATSWVRRLGLWGLARGDPTHT